MKDYKQEINELRKIVAEATDLLNDPEAINALREVYKDMSKGILPLLTVLKDTLGADADKLVDETLRWSAKKAFVAYIAYQKAGFNKLEAMQLTLNAREDLLAALRNAKS